LADGALRAFGPHITLWTSISGPMLPPLSWRHRRWRQYPSSVRCRASLRSPVEHMPHAIAPFKLAASHREACSSSLLAGVGAVRRLSCAQCLSSRRGHVTHARVESHYTRTNRGLVLMPASCVRVQNDPTMTHGFY